MSDMTAWGHVLLASDNPVNQRVTKAMLEKLGFHVDVVDDGAEAVNAAARTPYRAILMDCQLPILDGYLATTEIRRWQGASRGTPVIAVTASAPETDERRCRAAGMDDFLTKPITLQSLAEVLARWAPDSTDEMPSAEVIVAAPELALVPDDGADPVLDVETIERLERLGESTGEDLMGQLTVLFLADADAYVLTIRDAIAAHDFTTVVRSAHTFSGASGNLGALHLSGLCASLATDETEGDPLAALELLDEIVIELERVRAALASRRVTS